MEVLAYQVGVLEAVGPVARYGLYPLPEFLKGLFAGQDGDVAVVGWVLYLFPLGYRIKEGGSLAG